MELAGVGAAPGIAVGPIWRHSGGSGGRRPVLDLRAAAELASGELMALAARLLNITGTQRQNVQRNGQPIRAIVQLISQLVQSFLEQINIQENV